MAAKKLKPADCSNCFYKFNVNFDEDTRNKIFSEYIQLSYERQKDFLFSIVKQNNS